MIMLDGVPGVNFNWIMALLDGTITMALFAVITLHFEIGIWFLPLNEVKFFWDFTSKGNKHETQDTDNTRMHNIERLRLCAFLS